MKRFILPLFILMCVLNDAPAQNLTEAAIKHDTGVLSFFVRDAENEYGLSSKIQISGNGKEYILNSGDGGHTIFENKAGRYDVVFIAEGHLPLTSYFQIEPGTKVNIQALLDRESRTPVQDVTLPGALVEGYVVDEESGKPLSNVVVSMDDLVKASSAENGYFSVFSPEYSVMNSDEDRPVRKSFTFSAPGYASYTVNNLLLTPTKISVNISMRKGEGEEHENYFQHILDGTSKDVEMYEENLLSENANNQYRSSSAAASGCSVPSSIRVGTGCSCTSCSNVSVMSLQTYTEKGIDNEWISSWQTASIAAGSIAYRTYGAWYVNHPVKPNYDIASTTCNQVWGSASYANCVAAALSTSGTVLTADGNTPVRSEYSAENNGSGAPAGASCGNCKSGTGNSYPCFSDNVCCGKSRSGHGRGMCQWGTQRWAQNGKSYTWIISQYYSPGSITICGSTPPSCGTAAGLTANSITAGSAVLSWAGVTGATSYNLQYKAATASTWTTVTVTPATATLTGLTSATAYQFKVQAVCTVTGNYSAVATFTTATASSSATSVLTLGSGTSPYSAHPFGTIYMDERTQYVVTKAELTTAGFTAGPAQITSMALNVISAASQAMLGFSITIEHVSATQFSSTSFLSGTNATAVYSGTTTAVSGWNTFNFTTPFQYNGSSNLLVTICWNNSSFTTNSSVQSLSYSTYKALYYRADLASSGVCGKTTGTRSYYRPNLKFTFSTASSMMAMTEGEDRSLTEETDAPSGADEPVLEMYPNPFDGKLIYGKLLNADGSAALSETAKNIEWSVYDLLGKKVHSGAIAAEGGEFTLLFDEGSMKPGFYMIYLMTTDNKRYQKKVVVR